MFSHDIYTIALSKTKNLHYLKRYLRFIESCKIINEANLPNYVENHHILPKARDLFPEFVNHTKNHKWNSVNLSFRQHLIAHVMLWKIFGGSQTLALMWMLSENNKEFESLRKVPSSLKLRYLEKMKISARGKSYYYDDMNKMYYLDVGDPLIKELGLAGNSSESVWYNDGIKNYRLSKNKEPESHWIAGRLIEFSDEVLELLSKLAKGSIGYNDGINNFFVRAGNEPESHWVRGILANKELHEMSLAKRSKRFAGSKWYNDGIHNFNVAAGKEPDPNWFEGKIFNFSEEGLARLSKKASGSKWYNNGVRNYKVDAGMEPDPTWIKGRLVDSEIQKSVNEFNRKKFTGSQFWNDGVKNHLVFVGQEPESHWVKGMLVDDVWLNRAKEFGKKRIAGCTVYNDGIKAYKVRVGGEPEAHWVRGYLPRPVRRMFNNGIITKMFEEDPGIGWALGRIKKEIG